MFRIDLNCDLGEIEGIKGEALDDQMMNFVSSINIACGGHAGSPVRIRKLVRFALERDIAIGAHPGYADRANFGRIVVPMAPAEITSLVWQQIQVVACIADELGGRLTHVKPHGALYNQAAKSRDVARAIAIAVKDFDPACKLTGLAGSSLPQEATAMGLMATQEVFADRNYFADGSLVPRSQPEAVLYEPQKIAVRAASIIETRTIVAVDGTLLTPPFDTMCLHSDTPNAVDIASEICRVFAVRNIAVSAKDEFE